MKKLYHYLLLLGFGVFANSIFAADREPVVIKVQGKGVITSQPAGIMCPTDCFENYREKITVTLTASAAVGNSFLGWSGACAGKEPVCVIKIKKSRTISAKFTDN